MLESHICGSDIPLSTDELLEAALVNRYLMLEQRKDNKPNLPPHITPFLVPHRPRKHKRIIHDIPKRWRVNSRARPGYAAMKINADSEQLRSLCDFVILFKSDARAGRLEQCNLDRPPHAHVQVERVGVDRVTCRSRLSKPRWQRSPVEFQQDPAIEVTQGVGGFIAPARCDNGQNEERT